MKWPVKKRLTILLKGIESNMLFCLHYSIIETIEGDKSEETTTLRFFINRF